MFVPACVYDQRQIFSISVCGRARSKGQHGDQLQRLVYLKIVGSLINLYTPAEGGGANADLI